MTTTRTLVTIAPGHQLAPDAAASALRMFAAGCPVAITEAWRSTATQAERRDQYLTGAGAFALPPGKSRHEVGEAVDWKASAAAWVRAHPEHGWRFTNRREWWHAEYFAALDVAPRPAPPNTQEEDDMFLIRDAHGTVGLSTPTGLRQITPAQLETWWNLGYRYPAGMDALADGPMAEVVASLGGWVK
ncbi:MAG: M15 family metallopeptidase [Actinobacteria bacterium]|nr:M15 family metallopeptidase [Actinomycetota bacterium]MCG2801461.1 M15 family metallopeptidase [Cellulomonas sp.]